MTTSQNSNSAQNDDIPETCKECGCNCSPTERRICLAELEGEDYETMDDLRWGSPFPE